MTNFEKYRDEILKIAEAGGELIGVKDGKPVACESLRGCGGCDLAGDKVSCLFDFIEWACKEDGEERDCRSCKHYDEGNTTDTCRYCKRCYIDKFEPKPKKTRQSEFLKAFPNAKLIGGKVLSVDPCLVDRTYNTELCVDGFCKACKEKYWSQEVE